MKNKFNLNVKHLLLKKKYHFNLFLILIMVHVSKRAFEIMVIVIFQNLFAGKYIKIIFYFKKIILTSTHQS